MEIMAPTNWDDALIPEFKVLGIKEVYGKLAIDVIGGGRQASGLVNISRKNAAGHVKKLLAAGIRFNYILNASCLAGVEFTHSGRREIDRLLHWMVSIGINKVTVTIPLLVEIIKETCPEMEICISTLAGVDSLAKARYWQDVGAHEITLQDTRVNRNFELLQKIRAGVSLKLRLNANTGCMHDCPFSQYHALLSSHGSQRAFSHKAGFSVEYCLINCKHARLSNPVDFIRSQWIRPEDLGIYEEIGINGVKLIDRRSSTQVILTIVRAYVRRRYDGNLVDLLPIYHGKSPKSAGNFLLKLRYLFHPFENDMPALFKLNSMMKCVDVYIDNRKLDGFLEHMRQLACDQTQCAKCGYCAEVAAEALRYDGSCLENAVQGYDALRTDIIKGKY